MDVKSLYTNIDTAEGIQAVIKMMNKHPDPKRPDTEILELLFINLSRNDFMFDKKWFLQTKGTVMGKKFAPAYANIFMACWEEQGLQIAEQKPTLYFRFLDDIWGTWDHSLMSFYDFIKALNSLNSSITVTAQICTDEVIFFRHDCF